MDPTLWYISKDNMDLNKGPLRQGCQASGLAHSPMKGSGTRGATPKGVKWRRWVRSRDTRREMGTSQGGKVREQESDVWSAARRQIDQLIRSRARQGSKDWANSQASGDPEGLD